MVTIRGWLNRFEPMTLMGFAGLAGCAFVLQRLTSEVLEGETLRLDQAILLLLRKSGDLAQPIAPHWVTHAVGDLTSLGGVTVLSLITLVATIFLLLDGKRGIAAFLFLSVAGGWIASSVLKLIVARERPDVVPHLVDVSDPSFPSGHAMVSAVTYLTIAVLFARTQRRRAARIFIVSTGVALTLIIGLSRIYLGVHYPTDVMAGWCAGALWALACFLLSRQLIGRTAAEAAAGDDAADRPADQSGQMSRTGLG